VSANIITHFSKNATPGQHFIRKNCLKKHLFLPFGVKNARNTQSIPALFALTGRNICLFQVLHSFEVGF